MKTFFRGDAVAVAQITHVTPANVQIGDVFTLSINGKSTSYTAAAATVADVVAGLVTGWTASTIPEFTEITAADATTHVILTASSAGIPFIVAANVTGTGTATIAEITRSQGRGHWDSPRNWTLNQIPNSGDDVIVGSVPADILHGLVQRVDFTADPATDTVTFVGAAHFRDDQIVHVRNNGGGLPGGLSVSTDYYVIALDRDAGTCQLALIKSGAPIDITSSGTGIHTIAVELDSITVDQSYTGKIGLAQRNRLDYFEYRPIYLSIGLSDPSGGANRSVLIGTDEGSGSGRLRLDLRGSTPDVEIIDTGGSIEPGVPALLLLIDQPTAQLIIHSGEVGVARLPAETATIGAITQYGGTIKLGEVTVNSITINQGNLFGQKVTMSGTLIAR